MAKTHPDDLAEMLCKLAHQHGYGIAGLELVDRKTAFGHVMKAIYKGGSFIIKSTDADGADDVVITAIERLNPSPADFERNVDRFFEQMRPICEAFSADFGLTAPPES